MFDYYRKYKRCINPLLVYIFLFIFFLLTPVVGDDYTWLAYANTLSREGGWLSSFSYLHENLNGRILGNTLELSLIANPVAAALFKSSIIMMIFYLLIKIIRPSSRAEMVTIAILVIFPSAGMFGQAISWSAGFYNYVVPMVLLLTLYYAIAHVHHKRWYHYTTIGLVSIAVCLFAENISLITLFAVGLIGLIGLFKTRRINWAIATAFTGLVVGSIMMFSSPAYTKVVAGNDHYRGVASLESGLLSSGVTNLTGISQYLIYDMMHIYIVTSALLVFLISRIGQHTKRRAIAIAGLVCSLSVLLIFQGIELGVESIKYHTLFVTLTYGLYTLMLLSSISLAAEVVKDRKEYLVIILCYVLGVLYVSPFVFITPFGYRNFYVSYFLFSIILLLILRRLPSRALDDLKLPVVVGGMAIAVSLLIILGFSKYTEITNTNLAREQVKRGETTLYLHRHPFHQFIHSPHTTYKLERYIGGYNCHYTRCDPDRVLEVIYR